MVFYILYYILYQFKTEGFFMEHYILETAIEAVTSQPALFIAYLIIKSGFRVLIKRAKEGAVTLEIGVPKGGCGDADTK